MQSQIQAEIATHYQAFGPSGPQKTRKIPQKLKLFLKKRAIFSTENVENSAGLRSKNCSERYSRQVIEIITLFELWNLGPKSEHLTS